MPTASDLGQFSLMSQIGGAFSSAIGGFYASKLQKTNLDLQAYMADTNAKISEMGAQSALNQGQQQIGALTIKAGQLKGSQRAAMAANGIDLGEGNAAEIQASTDLMKQNDVNTIKQNAIQNAWGYRTQATNQSNQAMIDRTMGSAISPLGTAATSLLGSAGSVASSWYSLNKTGALNGTPFQLG